VGIWTSSLSWGYVWSSPDANLQST